MYEQVEVNGFGCADCAGGLAASLGREQVVCTARIGADAVGYIVFNSTVRGRSHGGLRLLPDVEEAELRDWPST